MTNRKKGRGRTSKKVSTSPEKPTRKSRRGRRSKKSDSSSPEESGSDDANKSDTDYSKKGEEDSQETSFVKQVVEDQERKGEESAGSGDGSWKVKSEKSQGGGIPKLKLCLQRPADSSPTEEVSSPRRKHRSSKTLTSPQPKTIDTEESDSTSTPKRSSRIKEKEIEPEKEATVTVRSLRGKSEASTTEPEVEVEPPAPSPEPITPPHESMAIVPAEDDEKVKSSPRQPEYADSSQELDHEHETNLAVSSIVSGDHLEISGNFEPTYIDESVDDTQAIEQQWSGRHVQVEEHTQSELIVKEDVQSKVEVQKDVPSEVKVQEVDKSKTEVNDGDNNKLELNADVKSVKAKTKSSVDVKDNAKIKVEDEKREEKVKLELNENQTDEKKIIDESKSKTKDNTTSEKSQVESIIVKKVVTSAAVIKSLPLIFTREETVIASDHHKFNIEANIEKLKEHKRRKSEQEIVQQMQSEVKSKEHKQQVSEEESEQMRSEGENLKAKEPRRRQSEQETEQPMHCETEEVKPKEYKPRKLERETGQKIFNEAEKVKSKELKQRKSEQEPEESDETKAKEPRRRKSERETKSNSGDSSEERAKEEALRSRRKKKKKRETTREDGEMPESPSDWKYEDGDDEDRSKTGYDDDLQNSSRRRRWGAGLTCKKVEKKSLLTISSDILKEIIPRRNQLAEDEVQLSPNDDDEGENKPDEMTEKTTIREKHVESDESEKDYEVEENESSVHETENIEEPAITTAPTAAAAATTSTGPEVEAEIKAKPEREKPEKEVKLVRKVSVVAEEAKKLQKSPSPPRRRPSSILYITNLVRPFTVPQLKELLARTGTIVEDGFWIDKIKSKCYVQYETEEQAKTTRHALHGVTWPVSNPKQLNVDFGKESDFEAAKKGGEVNERRIPGIFNRNVELKEKEMPPRSRETERKRSKEREEKNKKERREKDRPSENDRDKRSRPHVEPLTRDRSARRVTMPVREWDLGKTEDGFSPPRERKREHERVDEPRKRERERGRRSRSLSVEPVRKNKKKEEQPSKLLDDLFRKTNATPCIYWLPLTTEQIAIREEMRRKHMAEHEKRVAELKKKREDARRNTDKRRRRSKSHSRSRSPRKVRN